MPSHAEAKMKNSVMARSRTARAERLKFRIGHRLLICRVDDLPLVQEMRSERHHLFSGVEPAAQDDFLLTDRGDLDQAKLHFRLIVHDPDTRPAAAIMDGPDGHQHGLAAG